jgi:hypothetical protein
MDTPITISDRDKPVPQSHHLTIGALIFLQSYSAIAASGETEARRFAAILGITV